MYINYQPKSNGAVYATVTKSVRIGNKISKDSEGSDYLGRVLDREKMIFSNKKDGIFVYDLKTGKKSKPPEDFVSNIKRKNAKEPECHLDFGDAFFIDTFEKKNEAYKLIESLNYGNPDSVKALLMYYMLNNKSNSHAETWYEGSYAKILYPKANLTSQRISDMLEAVGNEVKMQSFFKAYIPYIRKVSEDLGIKTAFLKKTAESETENKTTGVKEEKDFEVLRGEGILIDSTGLPNSVHFPVTAINKHNGVVSEEVRLIYVVQHETGLPLYMRYVPGNVVDSTTLITTMNELKAAGINTKFAIFDAGYVTEANLRELSESKVSYLARLPENRTLFKTLVKKYKCEIESDSNLVRYGARLVHLKRVKAEIISGVSGYVYIGLDETMCYQVRHKAAKKANANNLPVSKLINSMKDAGIFCLISSRPIAPSNVLPLYYTRQDIEQVFDLGKNYCSMLPVCTQKEETFRGHLLFTFMATAIMRHIQQINITFGLNLDELFTGLRNHKCKWFPKSNVVIPQESAKPASVYYRSFKMTCPKTINLKLANQM